MADNVEVLFKRGTKSELDAMPIVDGQLLWNTETGETYIDVGNERKETGRKSSGLSEFASVPAYYVQEYNVETSVVEEVK